MRSIEGAKSVIAAFKLATPLTKSASILCGGDMRNAFNLTIWDLIWKSLAIVLVPTYLIAIIGRSGMTAMTEALV